MSSSTTSIFRGLILYGSQTGNAEEIAKTIRDEWRERTSAYHATIDFFCMNDYVAKDKELSGLPSYSVIVLVCSTTGNGDQPDNAIRFFRAFKKRKLEKNFLAGVRVAILGLGDSNYDKFNESGRVLEQLCQQTGAELLTPKSLADDGVGLEIVVEPFKKKFIEIATKLCKEHSMVAVSSASTATPQAAKEDKQNTDCSAHHSTASTPATITPLEEKKVDAAVTIEDLERHANDVVDNEKKIRLKIDEPAFMARIPKCTSTLKFHSAPVSFASSSFLSCRFQRIDSEAELRGYTPEAPSLAALASAKFLTTDAAHSSPHNRMVIHLELQLPLSSPALRINFSPGDSIGIYVANDEQMVEALLRRLAFKGDEIITIHDKEKKKTAATAVAMSDDSSAKDETKQSTTGVKSIVGNVRSHLLSGATLREIFLHCVDITSPPKKAFLRMLAEYCDDAKEKASLYQLLSREGFKEYSDFVFNQQVSLLDVLQLYPSCRPALAHVLDQLPPLLPRYYSITNSPLLTPTAIHIAFSVVQYSSAVKDSTGAVTHKLRRGVATSHLWKLATAAGLLPRTSLDTNPVSETLCSSTSSALPATIRGADGRLYVPIFLRRSVDFTLPEEVSRPLILIGPGTGVCPFRSFLQHRRQQYQAIASSGGRTSGWWRGLEMELGEEKEEEEESPLKLTNPRLAPASQTHTDKSNVAFLSANTSNNVSRSHSSPQLSDVRSKTISVLQEVPMSTRAREVSQTAERSVEHDERFGSAYLFFGCRDRSVDYLYAEEWQSFLADHTLTALYPAFSREKDMKYYVTHAMTAQGALLTDLLINHGAIVYVCGDAAQMAKDVQRSFEEIISQHENGRLKQANFVDAQQFINHLIKNDKRYRQDIWS